MRMILKLAILTIQIRLPVRLNNDSLDCSPYFLSICIILTILFPLCFCLVSAVCFVVHTFDFRFRFTPFWPIFLFYFQRGLCLLRFSCSHFSIRQILDSIRFAFTSLSGQTKKAASKTKTSRTANKIKSNKKSETCFESKKRHLNRNK